jgi:hypothetical protein
LLHTVAQGCVLLELEHAVPAFISLVLHHPCALRLDVSVAEQGSIDWFIAWFHSAADRRQSDLCLPHT